MKILSACIIVLGTSYAAFAQNDHSMHVMHPGGVNKTYDYGIEKPSHYQSPASPSPKGQEIRKYAIDEPSLSPENFGTKLVHDNEPFFQALVNRSEYRSSRNVDIALWDTDIWYGTDYNKFYVESEGEYNLRSDDSVAASIEVFWNHTIATFWDTQLGMRHDFIANDEDRTFLAAGVQGMAPYIFEVDATAYISDEGDPSFVVEAERDFYFTQRLVLQPRIETEIALTDVPEYNIGAGVTGFETGLRMRYEITRKFAPYIGVSWERNLGKTANLLQADNEDINETLFVAGIRMWF